MFRWFCHLSWYCKPAHLKIVCSSLLDNYLTIIPALNFRNEQLQGLSSITKTDNHQWSYPLRSARSYTISQIYLFKLLLQKRKLPKCGSTWAKVELLQSNSQPHKTRFWDQLVGYTLAMMQLNRKHVHGKSRANQPFKAHQYFFSQFISCDMTVVLVEQPNATYHLRHFKLYNRQIILTHD